jgi:hypothetical protein
MPSSDAFPPNTLDHEYPPEGKYSATKMSAEPALLLTEPPPKSVVPAKWPVTAKLPNPSVAIP